MESRGEFEKFGGDCYLADVLDFAPLAANFLYHAGIVLNRSVRRQAIANLKRTADQIQDGGDRIDRVLADARDDFDAVTAAISPGPASDIETVCLADVRAEAVSWLWPGRIPLGKLTLIVGDPSMGKSFLSMALAATVTAAACGPTPGASASRRLGRPALGRGRAGRHDPAPPRRRGGRRRPGPLDPRRQDAVGPSSRRSRSTSTCRTWTDCSRSWGTPGCS